MPATTQILAARPKKKKKKRKKASTCAAHASPFNYIYADGREIRHGTHSRRPSRKYECVSLARLHRAPFTIDGALRNQAKLNPITRQKTAEAGVLEIGEAPIITQIPAEVSVAIGAQIGSEKNKINKSNGITRTNKP